MKVKEVVIIIYLLCTYSSPVLRKSITYRRKTILSNKYTIQLYSQIFICQYSYSNLWITICIYIQVPTIMFGSFHRWHFWSLDTWYRGIPQIYYLFKYKDSSNKIHSRFLWNRSQFSRYDYYHAYRWPDKHICIYRKPTDTYNYVLFSSAHPLHCKLGIPYSQFLRIRRICTFLTDFDMGLNLSHPLEEHMRRSLKYAIL